VSASGGQPLSRNVRITLAVVAASLFAIELIALATGQIEIAAVCAAVITLSWFALRSWIKRRDAEG
jgi:hypothetical protein